MADDKKKVVVLGALGAVLLGVGAFQFIGGGATEPVPAKQAAKKTDPKKVDAKKPVANPLVALALPRRDPFKVPNLPGFRPDASKTTPEPAPSAPPEPVQGSITPPKPLDEGSIGLENPLTPTNIKVEPVKSEPAPVTKVEPVKPPEPVFGYTVSGVIVGERSAAVFTDAKGNQRLVTVGTALDGDSRLTKVEPGKVFVRFRGKTIRLTVGGSS